jgi:NAD(P)-dependent dehydrogenase (short-subunit alcohol dehydrogenase family)
MTMNLSGKVAIVTGSAAGIGKSCAESLYEAGASVIVADIDADQGVATVATLGARAAFIRTDVRQMADMQAMADLAVDRFGGVDILVNNAAVAINGAVDEVEEDTWTTVIDTNLNGYWRAMRVTVPIMRERGSGSIVNMSSVQGLRGFKGWPAYAASKGAINALTVQTSVDLAPAGIRVNAVAPGTILTPMNEKIFADLPDGGAALRAEWNRAHPIGRFGQPQEVAKAVLFLASDTASFITGEILRVDGGLAMRGE